MKNFSVNRWFLLTQLTNWSYKIINDKICILRAHSSAVEQFPLKEKVDGSNPSGLTFLVCFAMQQHLPEILGYLLT